MEFKVVLLLTVCLFFLQPVFSQVFVSPSELSISLYGGQATEKTVSVSSGFSTPASVSVNAVVSNVSGDLNGFSFRLWPEVFVLQAGDSKDVMLYFETVPSIAPEPYTVLVEVVALADYTVAEPEPVQVVSGGGGVPWLGKRAVEEPVDENVAGNSQPVVVPGKPDESVVLPELPVEEPELLPEEKPEGLLPWHHAVIAFILALCFLGFLFWLFLKLKKRRNKKEDM